MIEPSWKGAAMQVLSETFSVRVADSDDVSRLFLTGRFELTETEYLLTEVVKR